MGYPTITEYKDMIPGGVVRLLDVMGSDLDIVNSARISYDKWHDEFQLPQDRGLINFLMKGRHGTPFEMVEFVFQIRCPITVAREWFRHRIGSFNEMSGRYVKMKNEAYIPSINAIRTQKGKAGSYTYEPIADGNIQKHVLQIMQSAYDSCYDAYESLLEFGVAKELARNVLPQGLFTEFRWKLNARSLMNFLSLRNAPSAMLEIQNYAQCLEKSFEEALPETYAAFIANGRTAP